MSLSLFTESLAYLTAASHGLEEETQQLQEIFEEANEKLPEVNPDAVLLQPAVPIMQQESNWPLLTVAKSIFAGPVGPKRRCLACLLIFDYLGD